MKRRLQEVDLKKLMALIKLKYLNYNEDFYMTVVQNSSIPEDRKFIL